MAEIIELDAAVDLIPDGATIMVGGFLTCGSALRVLGALAARGTRDLTVITNDGGYADKGHGLLIANHQVSRLICSHVGTNPAIAAQMNSGELEVTLVPQGSLIEKIRCGGSGLGGVLTPTGLGTPVAEGKRVITISGKDFLLEEPLHADVALISGHTVDRNGNVWYKGTTRNFNQMMALAADTVICEADHLVGVGEIRPEDVITPGVLVDYIVEAGN